MRIRRRILAVDMRGRLLSERVEQLAEDPDGDVEEIHATLSWSCPACGRPIEKVQDIRGECAKCGLQCCTTCTEPCAVCQRPLCSRCRRGFADGAVSVCTDCLSDLEARLARQDRLQEEQAAFQRSMAAYGLLLKLMRPGRPEPGSLSEVIGHFVEARLTRRVSELADRLGQEQRNGRLLP